MKPIHVDHAPKLIKWKNKTAIIEFGNRFYSPSIFIVAFLSAFDFIYPSYLWLFIIITVASSAFVSYTSWIRWKKDFIYLAEQEVNVPTKTAVLILGTECLLQILVSILSFWWISHIPACVSVWTGLTRATQAVVWICLLVFTFLFHIFVWKRSSREMDICLRNTYSHLETV